MPRDARSIDQVALKGVGLTREIKYSHRYRVRSLGIPCGSYFLSLEFDGVGRHLRPPTHPPCTFISLDSSLSCIRNQPPERSCYTEIKSQLQQRERKRRRKKYRRRTRKRRRRKRKRRRKKEIE
ncbi:hypothetical protein ALC60_06779 [Trachymyrmex zeteki]|uniref:Uncharacterized protein n=1 Tax=Mycetomoellerius zeteki TaxID=64791 RepID=A0A151X1R9_9HYME|nr:hypothetical protein ALC60_06779 [Trachymyrmex zeteki]